MSDDIKKDDEIEEDETPIEEGGVDVEVSESDESSDEGGVELTVAGRSAVRQKKSRVRENFSDDGMDPEEGDGQLTIDVYQTPDEIVIESPIAGVQPEDLDISITAESVTIKGSRQHERRAKDEDYFYQETYWGRFSRSIVLPQEVDAEKSDASVKNGVLTIRLPKLNRQRSKKIKVQSND